MGSPPQVRGKPYFDIPSAKPNRITPAGAGKTISDISRVSLQQDHPRRCGENIITGNSTSISPGSPPQVRGKLFAPPRLVYQYRITPAGAGKTFKIWTSLAVYKDHPRRCGENLLPLSFLASFLGSPPQVRGKRERSLTWANL